MSEDTQETQETQEIKTEPTITVAGKTYIVSSMSEKGINLINDIQKVEKAIGEHQRDISIANIAKIKLLEIFVEEAKNFTELAPATDEKAN